MEILGSAAVRFAPRGAHLQITEFGTGNINRTFLVSPHEEEGRPFLLQRLNTHVFHQPDLVMGNIGSIVRHLRERIPGSGLLGDRRWETPDILRTPDGHDHWCGSDGSFWRAISFIEESHTLDLIDGPDHAREVGFALGTFHTLLSDLPADRLADTLPGFHVTPNYLRRFDEVRAGWTGHPTEEESWCISFLNAHRDWAPVLEQARREGRLSLRPIHGDPKVNNILLDNHTGRALSVIDLDTVKPGLIQYDIGDCLRSGCNPLGEETGAWEEVRFEPALAHAVLEGYCTVARRFLTPADFELLPDAIRLIAFELGMRFFTDHLEGNVYFRAAHPRHNLARALVQLKLAENIDGQMGTIRAMVEALQ